MNILVVDDEPVICSGAQTILQRHSHDVSICGDVTSGISLLKERSFDLLIVDYLLPGANGLELIHFAKEVQPSISIVFISGFITEKTVLAGISAGIFAFLPKPFTKAELLYVIQRAERRKGMVFDELAVDSGMLFLGEISWLRLENAGKAFIGVDIRLAKTLNPVVNMEVEPTGSLVRQGNPFVSLVDAQDNPCRVFSPATGIVEAVNPACFENPDLILDAPLERTSWIAEIKLSNWDEEKRMLKNWEGRSL